MNLQELSEQAENTKKAYETREQAQLKKVWTAEEIYQALVSDVGDLGRLVLAKEGFRDVPDVEASLAHEFSEILYAVLLLAKEYNIDLETAFLTEMQSQQAKIKSTVA